MKLQLIRNPGAPTCTTSMTSAPPPVEYMGNRKRGSRKRTTKAATHRTKLCQTPTEEKTEDLFHVFGSDATEFVVCAFKTSH